MTTKKVKLVLNPHYQKSGTKSYVHLMRKYHFHPTKPGLYFFVSVMQQMGRVYTDKPIGGRVHVRHVLHKRSADGDQVRELGADDVQNDSMYHAEVSIGTPAQTMSLDLDTGSADFWVWSKEMPSLSFLQENYHTLFDSNNSTTFKDNEGSLWRVSYEDGSCASGTVGNDNVDIGGMVIKGQDIKLAKTISFHFASVTGDGLLGLAFGNTNTVRPSSIRTPIENMISQSDIPKSEKIFTAKLGSWLDSDETDHDKSFYTFGYIDQATVTASKADIYFTPVDSSQGFWEFTSAAVHVNQKIITRCGNKAIADTSSTLTLVDDETCQAIYDTINGAYYDKNSQGYIYPSDIPLEYMPLVSFSVGDKLFMVQREHLGFAEANSTYVYGAIQSRGSMDKDVLGHTFFNAIYAVFDIGNLQFGALQPKGLCENTSVPSHYGDDAASS